MKKIIEEISEVVAEAFERAGYDAGFARVTVSNRPDLCEYQCNGAMAAKKQYKKAPIQIAGDVVAYLQDSELIEKAEAVMPGFINITLNRKSVAEYLQKMA